MAGLPPAQDRGRGVAVTFDPRRALTTLFERAVAAARGRELLAGNSHVEGDTWCYEDASGRTCVRLPSRDSEGKVRIFGAGKAAASLASGLETALGDRLSDGLVIVKHGHAEPLRCVSVLEAGHPTPDQASVEATRELVERIQRCSPQDTIFFVISGGASSLLFAPANGVPLEQKRTAVQLLVNSGAPIDQINIVRKHLSAVKGGRLRLLAPCAEFCTLAISDVIGDDPLAIGSGPTVADPSSFADALAVLEQHHIADELPDAVVEHLRLGAMGQRQETPKTDRIFDRSSYRIVASNRLSLQSCQALAEQLGYRVRVITDQMCGDTHSAARSFAASLRAAAIAQRSLDPPMILLAGGETTLAVRNGGLGGRNQEFALVAASELRGIGNAWLLAAGTDGTDGPTDAAGAFVDGTTIDRALGLGLDPQEHLQRHDVYPLLDALGALYRTGATGTNVMDLVIGIVR